jgi:hypothetical protein
MRDIIKREKAHAPEFFSPLSIISPCCGFGWVGYLLAGDFLQAEATYQPGSDRIPLPKLDRSSHIGYTTYRVCINAPDNGNASTVGGNTAADGDAACNLYSPAYPDRLAYIIANTNPRHCGVSDPYIWFQRRTTMLSNPRDVAQDDYLTGTLILSTNPLDRYGDEGKIYSIDMQSMAESLMFNTKDQANLAPSIYRISPDRKWYIYFEPAKMCTGSQLHISSINGQESPVAYWDPTWGDSVEWLDNQRLIVRSTDEWLKGIVIVLNPFTGEWQKRTADEHVISNLSIFAPVIYYNPSLEQAIYSSGDSIFILWDIQSNQDIWLKRGANFWVRPSWSPGGSQFAMVVTDLEANQSDIHLVDSSGKEARLTNLAETYPSVSGVYISEMEWSPDGRYIAFLVSVSSDVEMIKGPSLMVVG